MDTALIAALSALGGALIGSLSSFAGICQETARALRKELFAAATTAWNRKYDYAREHGGRLIPLEDFIIDFMSLEDIITNYRDLSDEELFALLKKCDSQYHKLVQYRLDELSPKESCSEHSSPTLFQREVFPG